MVAELLPLLCKLLGGVFCGTIPLELRSGFFLDDAGEPIVRVPEIMVDCRLGKVQGPGHLGDGESLAKPAIEHAHVISLAASTVFAGHRLHRLLDQVFHPGPVEHVGLLISPLLKTLQMLDQVGH